ncbi:MAG: hypothetical protein ACW98D_21345, partial [Promethearchaeota archaeon]
MRTIKYLLLLSVLTISWQIGFCQYKMINQEIIDNKLSLIIQLESLELFTADFQQQVITNFGYFDESKTGQVALPSKSIFIGIPANSQPKINFAIIKNNVIQSIMGINPEIHLLNDSTISYNYFPEKLKKTNFNNPVQLKGFLWIGDIYCAHVDVNQYRFDYDKSVVNEIKELKIELVFDTILDANLDNEEIEFDQILLDKKSPIINYLQARNFKVNNPQVFFDDTTDNWINYEKSYLKMKVAIDGIYRINYDDLIALGININVINPKTINIYSFGVRIPIYIAGENDNSFDPSDFIEFIGLRNMGGYHREESIYGMPYNTYLARYTDSTTYWLTWDESSPLRVKQVHNSNNLNPLDTLLYYHEIIHYEKNIFFDFPTSSLVRRERPDWLENEFWGWYAFGVGTKNNSFSVSDVYPNEPAKLLAKVMDVASTINSNSHLLGVSLNNEIAIYDSGYIDRFEQKVLQADIISDQLIEGNNILKIHSFETSSEINVCYGDWYEVEYPRYLKVENDSLNFSFPYLASFETKSIKLLNVTTQTYSLWKYGADY